MREYKTIPISHLVSDVAVDPVHVRELADSIKVSGPINPVLVREEDLSLIDGFHRVAAMKELGFGEVDCIITPCDNETFWDLRIISASTHKAVTFARVVDWVEECFRSSQLSQRYVSAASLFQQVGTSASSPRGAPRDVVDWVENKAQKWGLAVRTIENWLYTKQKLAPELLEAATSPEKTNASVSHYEHVARSFPNEPDMQRGIVQKIEQEDLTVRQTEEVVRAVKQASTPEMAQTILLQPISRTAEDLTRSATVHRLLAEPKVEPAPRQVQRELTGLALEVHLDLQQQVHNIGRLTPEAVEALTVNQRAEMLDVVDDLMKALRELHDMLGGTVEGNVVEGRVLEGR